MCVFSNPLAFFFMIRTNKYTKFSITLYLYTINNFSLERTYLFEKYNVIIINLPLHKFHRQFPTCHTISNLSIKKVLVKQYKSIFIFGHVNLSAN